GHESLITEVLVHTGQHYDYAMSRSFFDQMDIPEPKYHLDVGSGSHGDQTGRMLSAIEEVLLGEKPDAVLVYGDTNSTLAGALAAAKLHIPVGHVEGGMRSFNRRMPEEINRVLTDHVAKWHFCATETAVKNLKNEGITEEVHLVGDVMYDAVMLYKGIASEKSTILSDLGLLPESGHGSRVTSYALCTVHRAENTDDPARLRNILEALAEISKDMPVVFPVHPRTQKAIKDAGLTDLIGSSGSRVPGPEFRKSGIKAIDPVSYIDMLRLEGSASIILTDSGGIQKEAFWLGVPCITMRDETEWIETVEVGWNKVTGADAGAIIRASKEYCSASMVRAATQPDSALAFASILNILASRIQLLASVADPSRTEGI
ncbi:MAG: UDP-N-acetylglucosamine 2-epimerase (non-hydrolyzing), partial [Deltaproteobacteria bacterium]|nr:UDP-N-acetylglucosamine 2-epimerase (non-hydrolyzing) [Deltaproteobacteria bacterium]